VPQIPGRDDESLARLAKALGHPVRVAILRHLIRDGRCICGDLVALLPLAQSTVSQHLKILRSAGLLQGEIDGPRVCYCVDPRGVQRLRQLVEAL
jgi:ArsR family transcriptional regulator